MSENIEKFDLKQTLIEKRDENPLPRNNQVQKMFAIEMLKVLADYEEGKIPLKEYKRQMRLIKNRGLFGFRNGKSQPMVYTGLDILFDKAIEYFDKA